MSKNGDDWTTRADPITTSTIEKPLPLDNLAHIPSMEFLAHLPWMLSAVDAPLLLDILIINFLEWILDGIVHSDSSRRYNDR